MINSAGHSQSSAWALHKAALKCPPQAHESNGHRSRDHHHTAIDSAAPQGQSKENKGGCDHRQLAKFDTDVEGNKRKNKLPLRQAKISQYGGKPQPM